MAVSSEAAPPRRDAWRVALIGAGFISDVHAEALRGIPGVRVAAAVDPALSRARRLAEKWAIPAVFDSVEALLGSAGPDACPVDVAHVMVPPQAHRAVAESLLAAGLHVFLEKPMAESEADCIALQAMARANRVALEVNQNFVFDPALQAARAAIESGALGRPRHVACLYTMPLRSLKARQFGHWMFESPRNLLLEQAVHPLSQIDSLIGPVRDVTVMPMPPRSYAEDIEIQDAWLASLATERGTAQLQFAVGRSFPVWQLTVICDDGAVTVDCLNNRVARLEPSLWLDFYDSYVGGVGMARSLAAQSRRNLASYALSTLRLKPRSDPHFRGMQASMAAFYRTLDRDPAALDGSLGRRMVALCERFAATLPAAPARAAAPVPVVQGNRFDTLVIGGTGFIGVHLVARLLRDGQRVAVLARNVRKLPARFHDERVGVFAGDATAPDDIRRALDGASALVNLAHGGGAASRLDLERAIVGGARTVAEICLEAGVQRLVHVGTIASLDTGDATAVITGATPPDPEAERRGDYARAKALAELELMALHRDRGLPLVILRPGVVLGEGGIAFHSGLGEFNRDCHCIGWNRGDNPLPLVLVKDVADAIARALSAPGVIGRSYNLVGDVRLSARETVEALAQALGRPIRYHPQSPTGLMAGEVFKWAVKRLGRRPGVVFPSFQDIRARGLVSRFDTSDAKRDLGWQPVADRAEFIRRGIAVHAE